MCEMFIMINLVLIIVVLRSAEGFKINKDIDLDKFVFFDTQSV